MNKIIALLGCIALSGCAGNYVDKVSKEEIDKYCPNYESNEFHFGVFAKNSCNSAIEKNLDEINAARKLKREKLAEEERQQEIAHNAEMERLDNLAKSIGVSYNGQFTHELSKAAIGLGFDDGLYDFDVSVRVSYCSRNYCHGMIEGINAPIIFIGFNDLLQGSYIGGGYHRAYLREGKIIITKVTR